MYNIQLPTLPWPEPALPEYHEGKFGPWSISRTPAITNTAGYFLPALYQPPGWVIKYKGKSIWMSLTRMEIESHMPHLAAAQGHVVIAGLGMGFALYNIARKLEVTKVTVIERNHDIASLLDQSTQWHDWPGNEKVTIEFTDALTYKPTQSVDFLYADIWQHAFSIKALPQTQVMQRNIKATKVGYWTQEYNYTDSVLHRGYEMNLLGYRRFAREEARLPLIEQENERYPSLACAAVALLIAAGEQRESYRDKLFERYFQYLLHKPQDLLDSAITSVVNLTVNGKRLRN